ncbi:MAG TPA: glycosyltransferase family 2 protein [Solirubrobacteraceae bacterium]|nr:glycosyltransferase family 2 protein [Solirubrobacteraceae bacterium]
MQGKPSLSLAAVVAFLNEEQLLPRTLASLERQTRRPDLLLLVDDGSGDRSADYAASFAARHGYAQLLSRPRRSRNADRLAQAAELLAFQWSLEQLPAGQKFGVLAKLDADLEFPADFFERIVGALEAEPTLGIAGSQLSVSGGRSAPARERSQSWHVRGATKFYRAECWQAIEPLPPILGWDTIDETRARINGFDVRCIEFPDQEPLHLRPTGSYDGAVRGFLRRGVAAWGYGAHPLHVLVSAFVRMRERPILLGGFAYLAGYLHAAFRRAPRAEPAARHYLQREQLQRLQMTFSRGGAR